MSVRDDAVNRRDLVGPVLKVYGVGWDKNSTSVGVLHEIV